MTRTRFSPDFMVDVRDENNDSCFCLKWFRRGEAVCKRGSHNSSVTPEQHQEIENALLTALEFWRSNVRPRPAPQGPATVIPFRP
jgi:hypothetical protein